MDTQNLFAYLLRFEVSKEAVMNRNYSIILGNGTRLDFKSVFNQYFNTLVLFAGRYLGEREECESLVQDTFLALWENRREFPDEVSVKAYLYTTVRNKALNVLKHRKVEREYVNDMLREEDTELYYMKSVIEEETRRLIFTAIDSLPEHSRKVCLLYMEGMDNQEIADELQVSLNTVKFHKKNAYKLLRDKLKDQFYLLFLI